jgi:hypothetical protein
MKTSRYLLRRILFAALLLSLFSADILAQEDETSAAENDQWTFLIEPYILFPNMKGTVGLGILPDAPIDANTNDIFGNLKMGAMLNLEASNDTWAVGSDFIYMNLSRGVESGVLIDSGDISAKQFAWEIMGLRRVAPWLEVGLGGLLNSIDAGVDLNLNAIGGGTTPQSRSLTKTWFDPMVITRVKSAAGEKFIYQFRGEIGGFGIGSDFAWQIQAYAGYRFSKLFQVTGGYRIISLDYTSGSGSDRFLYDVDTSGPVIRLGFNF